MQFSWTLQRSAPTETRRDAPLFKPHTNSSSAGKLLSSSWHFLNKTFFSRLQECTFYTRQKQKIRKEENYCHALCFKRLFLQSKPSLPSICTTALLLLFIAKTQKYLANHKRTQKVQQTESIVCVALFYTTKSTNTLYYYYSFTILIYFY